MGTNCGKNKSPYKYLETKPLGCSKMFVGYGNGSVLEFSMVENKIVHDLGKILDDFIISMTTTLDNKS